MELLILKSGKDYIRIKGNACILVQLDKASVFPLSELETVKQHVCSLKKNEFTDISIRKLVLTEEDFE